MSVIQISKTEKKGGPYNKKKQEERKNKVYELYFEKGLSALKIAEQLDVNRNTINQDIKFWYSQIATGLGGNDLGGMLVKQIERLDIQRKRLLDELDKESDLNTRLRIERFLFDIDQKLAGFATKMTGINLDFGTKEISDEEICSLVRSLVFSCGIRYPETADDDKIQQKTIALNKCDIDFAQNVSSTLRHLGLMLFENSTSIGDGYDLLTFGVTRGYLTQQEKEDFIKKRDEENKKEQQRTDAIEAKYFKLYGSDKSKWDASIREKMDEEISG